MQPNTLLDAILDEAGISHAGLAAHVNQAGRARGLSLRYEHTAVSRWLKGQRPRGQVPDLICEVLGGRLHRPVTLDDIGLGVPGGRPPRTASLTGFVERATALWRSDEQQRPHLLASPAVTGTPAVMPVWEWENPPEDVDVSRGGRHQVSRPTSRCCGRPATYELMYRRAGGVATRARIVGFLNAETAPLLRGSYTDALGRQLHRATGGLVAVAGICAYDSDAHGLAQRYFHQALRLAKASGDRGLGAYVIALLVNQAVLREYRQSVAFAEAALRAAGRHITPALAADLYAMQAKAYAHLGDGTSALACIRRAEQAAERIRPGTSPTRPATSSRAWSTSRWRRRCSASGSSRRPGARHRRRRQPGARPRPGAPAGHAQHDRTATGRRRQGGGHRRGDGRTGPGDGVPAAAGPAARGARASGAQRLRRHGRGSRTHRRGAARTAVDGPRADSPYSPCCDIATYSTEGGRTVQWTN